MIKSIINSDEWSVCVGKEFENSVCIKRAKGNRLCEYRESEAGVDACCHLSIRKWGKSFVWS